MLRKEQRIEDNNGNFFDQMREEAEYDNIRRKEEVKNILLMDEAC